MIARLMAENEAYLKVIQSGGASHRTPEHPDPEAFTGEDPTLLPNFLQQLDLKLEMNKDWWNSEPQLSYNIKDGVVLFDNVNAIKSVLQSAFGDIDAKATAQLKIFDMKQGQRPLRYSSLNGMPSPSSPDGIVGLSLLTSDGLSTTILPGDFPSPRPKTCRPELTQFMDLVRTCDNECRQVDANYFKKNTNNPPVNPTASLQPTTTPQLTTSNGGDPMDLSIATWGAKDIASGRRPQTDEERAARKAYCTAHGSATGAARTNIVPLIASRPPGTRRREKHSLRRKSPQETQEKGRPTALFSGHQPSSFAITMHSN
ncbi:hypothetical protein Forpi1262_v016962 [Fusarium oxysporum f. sp. raphani]|uniref:Uncharacterized protein n=1 Tax=Fusarium oxysporum f. sp. raphani TaxID=96318 RepID=A0A8J5NW86_FUSOX|nr:hypothetical protein Forpi1262_v016962 [Fusarium oxysporum f. sp. raphani]